MRAFARRVRDIFDPQYMGLILMKKLLVAAPFAAAAAATAGCSGLSREAQQANPAPCPNIIVLQDAARIIEFDGDEHIDNVAYTGEIVHAETVCRYFGDEPITAEVEIDLAFGKGPKATENDKVFNYFVAVTRTNLEVIAKQDFSVPVAFSERRSVVVKTEDIDRIRIPRANEQTSGTNFEIIVGFNLTPQQAIYNRSGKSLKFPELP